MWADAVLGPRLDLATQAVLSTKDRSLQQILGSPDLKFHSSMTLFALAFGAESSPFREALDRWFAGRRDGASLKSLDDLVAGFR